MQGILTFYIDFKDSDADVETMLDLFRRTNKELIEEVRSFGYGVMVVPCFDESCRVEKVDFDKPHPRFISRLHLDIDEMEKQRAKRAAERAQQESQEGNQ